MLHPRNLFKLSSLGLDNQLVLFRSLLNTDSIDVDDSMVEVAPREMHHLSYLFAKHEARTKLILGMKVKFMSPSNMSLPTDLRDNSFVLPKCHALHNFHTHRVPTMLSTVMSSSN